LPTGVGGDGALADVNRGTIAAAIGAMNYTATPGDDEKFEDAYSQRATYACPTLAML
jgi:hypothetical protein